MIGVRRFHLVIKFFDLLPEISGLAELAIFEIPVALAGLVEFEVGPLGEMPERWRLAVHKFSAEFDGNWSSRIFVSEDAAADASACFEYDDSAAGNAEVARGGQARRAGADDQDIRSVALDSHLA